MMELNGTQESAFPCLEGTPGYGPTAMPDQPVNLQHGFSKREQACLMLGVPYTGVKWLDSLIRYKRMFDLAERILQNSATPETAITPKTAEVCMHEAVTACERWFEITKMPEIK